MTAHKHSPVNPEGVRLVEWHPIIGRGDRPFIAIGLHDEGHVGRSSIVVMADLDDVRTGIGECYECRALFQIRCSCGIRLVGEEQTLAYAAEVFAGPSAEGLALLKQEGTVGWQ